MYTQVDSSPRLCGSALFLWWVGLRPICPLGISNDNSRKVYKV